MIHAATFLAEHRMVLGFLAERDATLILGAGVPDDLAAQVSGEVLSEEELLAAARATQAVEGGPIVVLHGHSSTIHAVLNDPEIRRARLLLLESCEPRNRADLEAVPWPEWPRVRHVDLEYCPPRVVEDAPGSQRLQGGVGLVVLDSDAREPLVRGPHFVQMARLLPDLRTPSIPARIAAQDLAVMREEASAYLIRLERAEAVIAALKSSLSWRVTAPLRAAKRALRRGS